MTTSNSINVNPDVRARIVVSETAFIKGEAYASFVNKLFPADGKIVKIG